MKHQHSVSRIFLLHSYMKQPNIDTKIIDRFMLNTFL